MEGERRVLQDRIEAAAFGRRLDRGAANGFDVSRMNSRNATAIEACTASTLARRVRGKFVPNSATAAPNSARISTHSSIEPSWFPQTPEMLVDQRLGRMRVGVDVLDREIGRDIGVRQRQES